MPLTFRHSKTVTGRAELILNGECEYDEFPSLALAIVQKFNMNVINKSDVIDCRMWIASKGGNLFCISWDDMICEISIMAWESTPDLAVKTLADAA